MRHLTYTLFTAANATDQHPYLIANVDRSDGGNSLEAFKSPEDFTMQAMEPIRCLILKDLVDSKSVGKIRITIKIDSIKD
jgi:hypothetical protein